MTRAGLRVMTQDVVFQPRFGDATKRHGTQAIENKRNTISHRSYYGKSIGKPANDQIAEELQMFEGAGEFDEGIVPHTRRSFRAFRGGPTAGENRSAAEGGGLKSDGPHMEREVLPPTPPHKIPPIQMPPHPTIFFRKSKFQREIRRLKLIGSSLIAFGFALAAALALVLAAVRM